MMDAVVYDIPSRTMLFHAVGQSSIKGSSTLMGLTQAMRERSTAGFSQATDDLITNFDTRFTSFVASIKEDTVTVEATPAIPAWNPAENGVSTSTTAMAPPAITSPAANMGGGGGGAISFVELVCCLARRALASALEKSGHGIRIVNSKTAIFCRNPDLQVPISGGYSRHTQVN